MPECGLARDMMWVAVGSVVGLFGLISLNEMAYRFWRRARQRVYEKEAYLDHMLGGVWDVHLDCQEIGWEGGDASD